MVNIMMRTHWLYMHPYIWVNSHMMTKNDLITGHLNYRPPYPTTIHVLGTDSRSRVTTTDPWNQLLHNVYSNGHFGKSISFNFSYYFADRFNFVRTDKLDSNDAINGVVEKSLQLYYLYTMCNVSSMLWCIHSNNKHINRM